MRFYGLALAAGALALAACSGGEGGNTGETAAAPGGEATATAAAPAGGAAAGQAAAITGTTHTVNMIGDDKGYRFEPAEIKIKAGDGIKWVMVSTGPHNVAFDQAKVGGAAAALAANMPNQMQPLMGPYLTNPNETYTVSFANVPAGTYDYVCTPHAAMNMYGKVTVE